MNNNTVAEKEMVRGLKNRHLQLIALGGIIGSGYFLGTGYVISKAGPASFSRIFSGRSHCSFGNALFR